jgi:DNA-binding NarL/FixJ family response regulator
MTLKALYQLKTGDEAAHQRRIDGHFRKLDGRRQAMIRAMLAGETLRQIGAEHGVSAGSVQDAINRAMERIRKAIADEPRYNHIGRASAAEARERVQV